MATLTQSITGTWHGLERGTQFIFGAAAMAVIALAVWAMVGVLREEYGTLFTQLSDGDAAAIVDSLKKQKVPYRLSDGGATISVPAERVHEVRLGLMSGNVALSGNVGFELFDKQGLGATEQSQRVSYQRALQGELARTISALENVKQARVHLVLPESSLFRRDKQESTAAVALTMKPGIPVERPQIVGVQRLVAASVPGLDPARVTITDHRGVTLSVASAGTTSTGASAGDQSLTGVESRLELQREVEAHIAHKVSDALDRAYGPGQAILSVAVALSFDAVKTTTQDLIPVRGAGGGVTEGGLKRRRQSMINGDSVAGSEGPAPSRTATTSEMEYEFGRRIEEVIASPGAVKRITLGVIVPPRISAEEQARLREFVMVAAGVDETRGDLVSVHSLATAHEQAPAEEPWSEAGPAIEQSASGATPAQPPVWDRRALLALGGALLLAVLLAVALSMRTRRRSLSDRERSQLLAEIKRALGDETRVASLQAKQS